MNGHSNKGARNPMAEMYPNDTYSQDLYQPAPKKGMAGWLIALIVLVVVICLCCICVVAALVLLGPAVGNTFSTIIETIEATTPMP
jgi:flagellar basal body-associated protein FliL